MGNKPSSGSAKWNKGNGKSFYHFLENGKFDYCTTATLQYKKPPTKVVYTYSSNDGYMTQTTPYCDKDSPNKIGDKIKVNNWFYWSTT